jgi:hypothetical protein
MTVASGGGGPLIQGAGFSNGDTFTIAIDPDTQTEEICYVTYNSGDTFTITRAQAGSSGVAHASGATVRHVLTSADLVYFRDGVTTANAAVPASTLTTKGDLLSRTTATLARLAVGSNGQVLTADSTATAGLAWASASSGSVTSVVTGTGLTGGPITTTGTLAIDSTVATLTGSQVLSNKVLLSPDERTTVSATAATGTVNFDAVTQGVLYYTSNASGNWTLNVRGSSSATLNSVLATGDSITVAFLVTQGSTAYYGSALTIDGTSVTPKYQSGTAFTAGNASSIDAYIYTIIKTGSAAFTVFASQTKFA